MYCDKLGRRKIALIVGYSYLLLILISTLFSGFWKYILILMASSVYIDGYFSISLIMIGELMGKKL